MEFPLDSLILGIFVGLLCIGGLGYGVRDLFAAQALKEGDPRRSKLMFRGSLLAVGQMVAVAFVCIQFKAMTVASPLSFGGGFVATVFVVACYLKLSE